MIEDKRRERLRNGRKRIAITGCQRSGTTLMGALWHVRPDVTYFGEGWVHKFTNYAPVDTAIGVYQLTTISQQPKLFTDDVVRIWMVRDVYDVVSSMIKLKWCELGLAGNEIKECMHGLSKNVKQWAEGVRSKFKWDGSDSHMIGALTYLLKHWFAEKHTNLIKVDYEHLVRDPEKVMKKVCDFAGVEFLPIMLNHHNKLSGVIHGTNFKRKIDKASIGKSKLTDQEMGDIDALRVGFVSALDSVPLSL